MFKENMKLNIEIIRKTNAIKVRNLFTLLRMNARKNEFFLTVMKFCTKVILHSSLNYFAIKSLKFYFIRLFR